MSDFEKTKEAIEQLAGRAEQKLDGFQSRLETLESYRDIPAANKSTPEAKAFLDYVRSGGKAGELKEMSIGGGAAAGDALVPEIISDNIIDQALAQSQIARRVRRTQVSTSDYVSLVNLRGQSASWSSETGTRSETDNFELRERRPTHGELYSLVVVSNWLLQDSKFDLRAMIQANAAAQFAKALDAAIYNGSGTNRPTGIFNSTPLATDDDASPRRDADTIEYVASTGDTANDMIELYFGIKPEYRQNAIFAMSSSVLGTVRQQRDSSGSGYLWQQNLGSSMDAPDGLLVGKPVVTWEDMASAYSNSPLSYPVLCGDFAAGYELTEIGPMSVIVDQVTTKGKTKLYLYQRFGGRILDNNAIKVIQA